MCSRVSEYVNKHFPDSKKDLFAVFIEKCSELLKLSGYQAMITQHAWMFLSSYEKLRSKLINRDIVNMLHLGPRAFEEIGGEVVQTTAFVLSARKTHGYIGTYSRLVDFCSQNEKKAAFLSGKYCYTATADNFVKIPGSPVSYWASKTIFECFNNTKIGEVYIPKFGMSVGDGERFIRLWYEVHFNSVGIGFENDEQFVREKKNWNVLDKGGTYRKWYGNRNHVVFWKDDGNAIKKHKASAVRSPQYFFKPHISWTLIGSNMFSVRYFENGFILDTASNCLYVSKTALTTALAILNSKISSMLLAIMNPTMNMSCGVLAGLPYLIGSNNEKTIIKIVENNISISRDDWDTFENSWDFKVHPLVKLKECAGHSTDMSKCKDTIKSAFEKWETSCNNRFNQLKANEEELNRIFIDIYGLQDELTADIDKKDITVRKADLQRDIRSFVSYAVGCMLGRYSLNKEGLVFAGGDFDDYFRKYKGQAALDKDGNPIKGSYAGMSLASYHYSDIKVDGEWRKAVYEPDVDNIIPITDEGYFEDDIVGLFVAFVKKVYGVETLEENLDFIANALGKGQYISRDYPQLFLKGFFQ